MEEISENYPLLHSVVVETTFKDTEKSCSSPDQQGINPNVSFNNFKEELHTI